LSLQGRSDGSVLCSLAGSQQLTKLAVGLTPEAAAAPAVTAALASLAGLWELSITECFGQPRPPMADMVPWSYQNMVQIVAEAPKAFKQLTPALQSLTRLTRLEYSHHVPVRQAAVQPLPSSLVILQLGQSDNHSAFLAVVRKGGLNR
jgi:hypothetical protein